MDIHLADGISFDIFQKVEVNVPVIFTTAYDQYMVNAFQHHSIDYILKPTKIDALEQSLKKYKKLSGQIRVTDSGGDTFIPKGN